MMTCRALSLPFALVLGLLLLTRPAAACVVGGASEVPVPEVVVPEVPADAEPGVAEVFTLARVGHEVGLLHLGIYFDTGLHVDEDPARAARFYRAAIRAGEDTFAPLLLARLHAEGRGAAFAPGLVTHYARLAASGDVGDTVRKALWQTLDPFFGPGWAPEGVYQRALQWWQAAKARSPVAQWRLGQRYWHGWGVPKCRKMSRKFLFDASIKGGTLLNFLYYTHQYRYPSNRESKNARDDYIFRIGLYWAADAGLPIAQRALGRELLQGRRGPRQPMGAYYWLRQAEESGLKIAQNLDTLWRAMPPLQRMLYRDGLKYEDHSTILFRPHYTE